MLAYITTHDSPTPPLPLPSLSPSSVSRETIRSKRKSDYNLNKTNNAPILTNTTLNVIRLVGGCCTHTHTQPNFIQLILLQVHYSDPHMHVS